MKKETKKNSLRRDRKSKRNENEELNNPKKDYFNAERRVGIADVGVGKHKR